MIHDDPHITTWRFPSACTQVVRALGARVICTAGSPAKRALLRQQGVQVCFWGGGVVWVHVSMDNVLDLGVNALQPLFSQGELNTVH